MLWSDVHFDRGTIFLPGTKTEAAPRTIPMSERLREFLTQLKTEKKPQPSDLIVPIKSARKCLQTACKKLELPQFTHHDFRHFFATTCIESGVDIPTGEPLAWTQGRRRAGDETLRASSAGAQFRND